MISYVFDRNWTLFNILKMSNPFFQRKNKNFRLLISYWRFSASTIECLIRSWAKGAIPHDTISTHIASRGGQHFQQTPNIPKVLSGFAMSAESVQAKKTNQSTLIPHPYQPLRNRVTFGGFDIAHFSTLLTKKEEVNM